jgi:hypothetical protein
VVQSKAVVSPHIRIRMVDLREAVAGAPGCMPGFGVLARH